MSLECHVRNSLTAYRFYFPITKLLLLRREENGVSRRKHIGYTAITYLWIMQLGISLSYSRWKSPRPFSINNRISRSWRWSVVWITYVRRIYLRNGLFCPMSEKQTVTYSEGSWIYITLFLLYLSLLGNMCGDKCILLILISSREGALVRAKSFWHEASSLIRPDFSRDY